MIPAMRSAQAVRLMPRFGAGPRVPDRAGPFPGGRPAGVPGLGAGRIAVAPAGAALGAGRAVAGALVTAGAAAGAGLVGIGSTALLGAPMGFSSSVRA